MSVSEALEKNILFKGQSLVEVATLLAVVGLAILAMQVYMQRGIQGKTKDLTDAIINPKGLAPEAYTSKSAESNATTTSGGVIKVSTVPGGGVNKDIEEVTTTKSHEWTKIK